MNKVEEQITTMQSSFVSVLIDIDLAILDKKYDIAHNIIRQVKKEILGDLEPKKEVITSDQTK